MSRVEKNKQEKKNINKIITIVLIIICLIASSYVIYYFVSRYQNRKSIKDIQKEFNEGYSNDPVIRRENNIAKVKELKEQNGDIRGWIQIDDTQINYPVLQYTDNQYYLTHDYKNDYNRYGSIFLKAECEMEDVNSNLILYGHNMLDDEMFNNLINYENSDFYENHKIVRIITDTEEKEYTIIAAFRSEVFEKREKNKFRFYNYSNFEDEEKYNEYIENIQNIMLYETGLTAEYGEQLLTMITCEYSRENGRMAVVAKRTK